MENLEFIQDVFVGKNRGKLYYDKMLDEYRVIHEKKDPTMSEKLELLTEAASVTAKLQMITLEMQLAASHIR